MAVQALLDGLVPNVGALPPRDDRVRGQALATSSASRSGLAILEAELEAGRVVAIMCAGRAWASCHRAHISAQMVSRLTDLRVTHL